jgi:hypothetical protein
MQGYLQKQKRDRFQRKVEEVMKFLTKGKFTKDMKKEGNAICIQDTHMKDLPVGSQIPMCFGLKKKNTLPKML